MPQDQGDIKGADAMKQAPTPGPLHDSDCARHNEPAYPKGPCDCSASLAPTAPVEASGSELWPDDVNREEFLKWLEAGKPSPQPSGETREAVRLALEDADALERVSEEADDNQWPDWAATMRQAASRIRRLALIRPAPVASGGRHSSGEGVELTFGMGALVVNTGTFGGDNAVFIAKATAPGEVGAYTGKAAFKRDVLQPGEHVLIFPTAQQAQAVADALVGAVPAQDDDKLRIASLVDSIATQIDRYSQTTRAQIGIPVTDLRIILAALKPTAAQEGGES